MLPYTWEEIERSITRTHYTPLIFERSQENQDKYDAQMERLAKQGSSVSQRIMQRWPRDHSKYWITTNTYPYILPEGKHYLLWLRPETSLRAAEIKAILKQKFEAKQVIWFKNIKARRSVQALEHYHVFVR